MRLAWLLIVGFVMLPRVSWASCYGQHSVHPDEATVDVPANTRVWIRDLGLGLALTGSEGAEPPSLWTADGELVPTRLAVPSERIVILTPLDELGVGSTYEIRFGDSSFWDAPARFTVTADADLLAPDTPVLAVGDVQHHRAAVGLPEIHQASLEVDVVETLVWLDIEDESTLDPSTYEGAVSDVFDPELETPFVGVGCESNWPGADRGSETTVRVATSDLAGNLSPWTDPETVALGCGCNAGSDAPGFGLLVPLLALGLRGRRRARVGE